MTKNLKRVVTGLLIVAGIVTIYFFDLFSIQHWVCHARVVFEEKLYARSFDVIEWNRSDAVARDEKALWTPRLRMYKDLIKRKVLIGKDISEIPKLLGGDYTMHNGVMLYSLGSDPDAICNDQFSRLLIIDFKNDKVTKVSYTTDF